MELSWLIELGATPAVIIIFVMGMMFATFALIIIRLLWMQNKDLAYKYNVLNTWAFAADKMLKLNMLKTGNSQGDVMLDWDSVPTLTDKQ